MPQISDELQFNFSSAEQLVAEQEKIFSVIELTENIDDLLQQNFPLEILLRGEISNFRGKSASGHCYFSLKDEEAVMRAVIFRNDAKKIKEKLVDGQEVIAKGRLNLYPPHGQYQFVISELQPAGLGELHLRFEKLKKELTALGYFEPQIKKALPSWPQRLALVTSPAGAVLRDMVEGFRQNFPHLEVVLFPVKVQGEGAAKEIAAAIEAANKLDPALEIIVIARGGGSLEDLWPFNERLVAEEIFNSNLPVVSAVGHQTDFTIADFVADFRAATPSAAAEAIVPDKELLLAELEQNVESALQQLKNNFLLNKKELHSLKSRPLFKSPDKILDDFRMSFDHLLQLLTDFSAASIARAKKSFEQLERMLLLTDPQLALAKIAKELQQQSLKLHSFFKEQLTAKKNNLSQSVGALSRLSPLAVLARGYSLASDERGKIIKHSEDVKIGQLLALKLAKGQLQCRVEKKKKDWKN